MRKPNPGMLLYREKEEDDTGLNPIYLYIGKHYLSSYGEIYGDDRGVIARIHPACWEWLSACSVVKP